MSLTDNAITVFNRHDLALTMIRAGFRTSIVFIHTQLSKLLLRRLYKELHMKSPSSGLLMSSAYVLSNRKNQIYATLFMKIYAKLHEQQSSVDVRLVIDAWEIFKVLVPQYETLDIHPQSINEAWTLTRDFRCATNYFETCPKCENEYLACDDSRLAKRCPFCNSSH
ncbi:FlhC family transcriptional regulator [Methylomonas koyamae]|uniref:FlhC family transcriptional regulator n=1 Tax=Methylomonas koyamae TaxID=702114 RepID=UPI0009EED173